MVLIFSVFSASGAKVFQLPEAVREYHELQTDSRLRAVEIEFQQRQVRPFYLSTAVPEFLFLGFDSDFPLLFFEPQTEKLKFSRSLLEEVQGYHHTLSHSTPGASARSRDNKKGKSDKSASKDKGSKKRRNAKAAAGAAERSENPSSAKKGKNTKPKNEMSFFSFDSNISSYLPDLRLSRCPVDPNLPWWQASYHQQAVPRDDLKILVLGRFPFIDFSESIPINFPND